MGKYSTLTNDELKAVVERVDKLTPTAELDELLVEVIRRAKAAQIINRKTA